MKLTRFCRRKIIGVEKNLAATNMISLINQIVKKQKRSKPQDGPNINAPEMEGIFQTLQPLLLLHHFWDETFEKHNFFLFCVLVQPF